MLAIPKTKVWFSALITPMRCFRVLFAPASTIRKTSEGVRQKAKTTNELSIASETRFKPIRFSSTWSFTI